MVAYTPTRMAQVSMAAAAAVVYTVPAAKSAIVKQLIIANVTAATVSAFVSIVPAGGAGAVANRIVHDVDVPPKSVLTFELSQVLPTGGTIAAHASSASALTLTISGLEFA
jgi:hypothetical protein